ncbi:cupin domain-containing protein [Chloroflexota bacterium]
MPDPEHVREHGLIIRPEDVPDSSEYGCRSKLLITPATGSALTGCRIVYHEPGQTCTVHAHPIAEDVIIVYKGKGEAFLGDLWYEVGEGDVIYAPESVKHGTRNPSGNREDFICYNWQVPFITDITLLPGAEDEVYDGQDGPLFSRGNRPKFDARIPESGYIEHIDRGALFVEYGAPMRFIVWPGMGARKISLHRAKHPPGFEFKTHIHPWAEDTILAFRGSGQGYLDDGWYDMAEGDVLYAPRNVRHGTRNHRTGGEDFICTGAAGPPQADLYRLAGYM